jgi:hypothetical protein
MSMTTYYILDDQRRVKAAKDVLEWGRWFETTGNRRVALTKFECGVTVSTVFLGMNHRFDDNGPPLLYETMVFELSMEQGDDMQWRYSSWDDAEVGHKATVRRVKELLAKAGLPTEEVPT